MPPCRIAGKIRKQMLASGFELRADEAQTQEPAPEGVLGVIRLRARRACSLRGEGLCADGQAELDVCLDLAGMQRAVECAELNGVCWAFGGKCRMQVEQVIARTVVMVVGVDGPVRVATLAAVPHRCETVHRGGFAQIDLPQKVGVDRLAPTLAAIGADAQCHGQQILFGIHNVHQPAQALRGVLTEANVDVDAAAAVHSSTGLLDAPDNRLYHLNVFPAAHRADHLGSGIGHGGIAFNDPLAAVWHGDVPIAQVVVDISGLRAEIGGDGLGCAFAAQTGGFNLDAKSLVFHEAFSLCPAAFPACGRWLRVTHSSLCVAGIATRPKAQSFRGESALMRQKKKAAGATSYIARRMQFADVYPGSMIW